MDQTSERSEAGRWQIARAMKQAWHRSIARAAVATAFVLMSGCGADLNSGSDVYCPACQEADADFYAATAVVVNPSGDVLAPAGSTRATVTVIYPGRFNDGGALGGPSYIAFDPANVTVVVPAEPGIAATLTYVSQAACAPSELPAELLGKRTDFQCASFTLVVAASVSATRVNPVVVSAQWLGVLYGNPFSGNRRVIERLGTYNVSFASTGEPPTPDFQVSAGGSGAPKVYGPRGDVPLAVSGLNGFAAPVTLQFDGLASGITGTIAPNPAAPGGPASLLLEIPARYAEGGLQRLRLRGTAGILDHTIDFTQNIEPIFSMVLSSGAGTVSSVAPLDVVVSITFDPAGPYAGGPPALALSVPDLPPGLTATFLPDANPIAFSAGTIVRRTLRLSTDGAATAMGSVQVRVTAPGLAPDLANERPYSDRTLMLQVTAGLLWEYVENGAAYALTTTDAVGIAMQSNNQPAIAWLEGPPGQRKVYLKRFDGTTFNASPAPGQANGLVAPTGEIEEARMAMTASDVAKVAFTYKDGLYEGAGVLVGSAGASWSLRGEYFAVGGQHVRSPRIAARGDALALSYILETGTPATTSRLFARGSASNALMQDLPGPRGDAALNVDADGSAVRDSTAIALGSDGNPWVAWIEQPADPAAPMALWLRSWNGTAWSAAVAVPTTRLLTPSSVQLLVEPSGLVVVSWLEGSPARLMVARLDPAGGSWTALTNTGNGDGSLNVSVAQQARDVTLRRDALGRLVVAWTEGGVVPSLWVKRQNADTTWGLLGTALSDGVTTRSPYIVSDVNSRLYLGYTRFYAGDLTTVGPNSDIFVARWLFP